MRKKTVVKTETEKIEVDLANTFFRRVWGLSLRKQGKMLFVFPRETSAKIDMALLSKKLYLYFLDENKEVISVQEAEPWTWNPKSWSLYSPSKKYMYLIESFEELNLDIGDTVNFSEHYKG